MSKPNRLFLLLPLAVLWAYGCERTETPTGPDAPGAGAQAPAPDGSAFALVQGFSQEGLQTAIAAQERHTRELMARRGVVGTGVGLDAAGKPVVKVFLKEAPAGGLPASIDGVPVRPVVTGEFFALQQAKAEPRKKPTCGKGNLPPCDPDPPPPTSCSRTERCDRPVPIGVSTGHPAITAGTIGARVTAGGNVWALSNNHVYADVNAASIGDVVIQPGTFDGGSSPADDIGTLYDFEPIVFSGCPNKYDAAIAATTTALVGTATPSGGYGTPKSQTTAATVNMKVKKFGRTTGLTKGSVSAINATVNVNYGVGVACFTNQIVITPGSFSAGGDSGSLIVADAKGRNKQNDRKPVGLLFAGSATHTIANPIDLVLARFGVTIDGE